MRVLITGSREWPDDNSVGRAIHEWIDKGGYIPPVDGLEGFTLVHGACPKGADAHAEAFGVAWVEPYGGVVERHPADWTVGRAAGVLRNQKMVDLGADVVLAFPTPGGRGTQDCIRRARKAGLNVVVYGQEE
jgi:hypothetical protein